MIFLSHSWTNKPAARRLVEALALEGLSAWLDEQQLVGGEELRPELRESIAKSDVYLYLVSEAANSSRWVQDELRYAIGREGERLKLIPVRIAGDETPLPKLLDDRLYRSLDTASGGAARLAHDLRDVAANRVPEGCRLSATVRLLPTGLKHTLNEARAAGVAAVDALFLSEAYERVDMAYWTLSEVALAPDMKAEPRQLEYTARVIEETHKQSRRAITELGALVRRYIGVQSGERHQEYFESGSLEAMRVLLHRLLWNCEYLAHWKENTAPGNGFVDRAHLSEPFDGHVCEFGDESSKWIGGVRVPPHGHPFAEGKPPMGWGLTNPFGDMMEAEIGRCLGHTIAKRYLAGTLPTTEMLDPKTLRYGLA